MIGKFNLLFILFVFIVTVSSTAQKREDHKIIVTLFDTSNAFEKVRQAMISNDFQIKDLKKQDTLITYPRDANSFPGVIIIHAAFSGNTITFTGLYSLKAVDAFGADFNLANYQPIAYYRTSKAWRIVMSVVDKINGSRTYTK